jgi:hypothetical protein
MVAPDATSFSSRVVEAGTRLSVQVSSGDLFLAPFFPVFRTRRRWRI